jgi:hypothetical protein
MTEPSHIDHCTAGANFGTITEGINSTRTDELADGIYYSATWAKTMSTTGPSYTPSWTGVGSAETTSAVMIALKMP